MLDWRYSDEIGWGFLLSETRPEYIHGRFIERIMLKEEVTDPFGQAIHYERVLFQETHFLVRYQHPHLEIRNAPRSISTFLSQLGRSFDFTVALTPIELDVMRLLSALEKQASSLTVSRITIADMAVATGVEAKCILVGERDVRRHLRLLTANRKFRITSVWAGFALERVELSVEIAAEGRVIICGEVPDTIRVRFRELVRDATVSKPQ